MSVARQVLRGSRYLVTRRCTPRQFWLKPTRLTNQVMSYRVAYAVQLTGVQLHAVCVLSNHWHAVVTDPDARLPEFLHWVHKHVAKCLNASYRRWENLWASEPPSAVRLASDDDVVDEIAYTLANTVAAGLVERGDTWPGVRTTPSELAGSTTRIERPSVFFRENGPMPKSVVLQIVRPAIHTERSDRELAHLVRVVVEEKQAAARASALRAGRTFLGVKAIRAQRPSDRPSNAEPRRGLNPRVAARDKWRRIEALGRPKELYRRIAARTNNGSSEYATSCSPAGRYAMRVHQGVVVADTA